MRLPWHNSASEMFVKLSINSFNEMLRIFIFGFMPRVIVSNNLLILNIKVLEKCTKNLIGHSRLAFNNHESNIDC